MKIVIVNAVYKTGSTGKIIFDLQQQFAALGHDVIVCYGRGPRSTDCGVYKLVPEYVFKIQSLIGKVMGNAYKYCYWSTKRLINIIEEQCPDIVNLHCINASSVDICEILYYLKSRQIKTVLSMHAEFLYTGGCAHSLACDQWLTGCTHCPQFHKANSNLPKSFFLNKTAAQWQALSKVYAGFDNLHITCVSDWLSNRAKRSPFFKNNHVTTVLNGLDVDVFSLTNETDIRAKHNLSANDKIVLHVTPNFYSPIKGGKYVLMLAKLLPTVKFIIVGYNGDGRDLSSNIIPIRFTRNQKELAAYYSAADITLLTSEKETFSMICAESLCCGTPVVGFKAGAPETISIPAYSEFVDHGDVLHLETSMDCWLNKSINKREISEIAKAKYASCVMSNGYLDVYKKLLNQQ